MLRTEVIDVLPSASSGRAAGACAIAEAKGPSGDSSNSTGTGFSYSTSAGDSYSTDMGGSISARSAASAAPVRCARAVVSALASRASAVPSPPKAGAILGVSSSAAAVREGEKGVSTASALAAVGASGAPVRMMVSASGSISGNCSLRDESKCTASAAAACCSGGATSSASRGSSGTWSSQCTCIEAEGGA